jgi:ribosomal-protein-alanine N-acetyltransferase
MLFIESDRLKLIPLTHQQLLLCRDDRAVLDKLLGLQASAKQISTSFQQEMAEAMQNRWLPDTLSYPDLYPWYTNWEIVCKSINTAIGSVGFGGYPDDYGQTSVGYVIHEQHRNNGYVTEALVCLLQWGFSFSVLKNVIADTAIDNIASQKVLQRTGFKLTKTEDGLLYYMLDKAQFGLP